MGCNYSIGLQNVGALEKLEKINRRDHNETLKQHLMREEKDQYQNEICIYFSMKMSTVDQF